MFPQLPSQSKWRTKHTKIHKWPSNSHHHSISNPKGPIYISNHTSFTSHFFNASLLETTLLWIPGIQYREGNRALWKIYFVKNILKSHLHFMNIQILISFDNKRANFCVKYIHQDGYTEMKERINPSDGLFSVLFRCFVLFKGLHCLFKWFLHITAISNRKKQFLNVHTYFFSER